MPSLTITPAPGRVGSLYYMKGDKQQYVARNLDLGDAEKMAEVVANATHNYPTQALKLAVFKLNGNARALVETIDVSSPALAGPDSEEMTHVATRPAPPSSLPASAGELNSFIFNLQSQQMADKDSLIVDLRDDKKRLETNERKLEDKIRELEFELKGKDRDHEYAVRDAVAAQPKGLAGIGEVVAQFPPEVMTMLAARFLGPMPTPPPAAPQLGAHLTEGQRQIIQALTDWASESEERAAKIYAIVSNALTRPSGLDEVIAFVQTTFPQLRAA